jgi:hypothetical protein
VIDPKIKARELYKKYVNHTNVAKEMALIDVKKIKDTIIPDGTTSMWEIWNYWSEVEKELEKEFVF